VNPLDDMGLSDIQNVVALVQIPPVSGKLDTAITRLIELVGLDHRAHGAVNDDDAALERFDQRGMRGA